MPADRLGSRHPAPRLSHKAIPEEVDSPLGIAENMDQEQRNRVSAAGDGLADPVEPLGGNEPIIIEVEGVGSGFNAGRNPRSQASSAANLAVEQPESGAEEFLRSEPLDPLPDDGGPLLRPERIDAQDSAVA